MKNIVLLTLAVFAFACGNKKEAIVEQIKSYKDSVRLTELEIIKLDSAKQKRYEAYHANQKPITFEDKSYAEMQRENKFNDSLRAIYDKQEDTIRRNELAPRASVKARKILYQVKIDSLELELKKY